MTRAASSTAVATTAASELSANAPQRFALTPALDRTVRQCVHCGLCLNACPTYRETGIEMESPRGRIYLVRALHEGRLGLPEAEIYRQYRGEAVPSPATKPNPAGHVPEGATPVTMAQLTGGHGQSQPQTATARQLSAHLASNQDPDVARHLDLCLGCRACETACPSGVHYGEILESARARLRQQDRANRPLTLAERAGDLLLHHGLTNRYFLAFMAYGLQLQHALRLPSFFGWGTGAKWLPPALARLISKSPTVTGRPFHLSAERVYPAQGEKRATVAFFTGCVMDAVMGDIHRDTIKVLQAQGVEVHVPASQTCCGALHAHAGDEAFAQELARRNLAVWRGTQYDAIINNSAGCGAHLRQLGHLLAETPAAAEAAAFSAKCLDITRFLVNLGLRPFPHPLPATAAYDAPCHLHHAQKETEAPLLLLKAITSLKIAALPDSDHCCGAAGLYTLTQPEMSDRVFAPKLVHLAKLKPDYLVTGNPGCLLQFQQGMARAGLATKAVHPLQLAARCC